MYTKSTIPMQLPRLCRHFPSGTWSTQVGCVLLCGITASFCIPPPATALGPVNKPLMFLAGLRPWDSPKPSLTLCHLPLLPLAGQGPLLMPCQFFPSGLLRALAAAIQVCSSCPAKSHRYLSNSPI